MKRALKNDFHNANIRKPFQHFMRFVGRELSGQIEGYVGLVEVIRLLHFFQNRNAIGRQESGRYTDFSYSVSRQQLLL
jgi:hypothetical protein